MNGDLNNIIEAVNEICDVEIRSRSRKRNIIDSKKIYMHIAVELNLFTLYDIGLHVGLNHATVLHHTRSFEMILKSDPMLRRNLEACWLRVNNILGLKNFDYRDVIVMRWKDLTIDQRKKLSLLADKYYNQNKVNEALYV
tara:strand:+ start:1384 stop:1803 length:420 start_codon:yes stop_codon:yes gene_type:complete